MSGKHILTTQSDRIVYPYCIADPKAGQQEQLTSRTDLKALYELSVAALRLDRPDPVVLGYDDWVASPRQACPDTVSAAPSLRSQDRRN